MPKHLQILISLLTKNNLAALVQHYSSSTESENIEQLLFLFQQGQLKQSTYDFYQQLATGLIEQKGLATTLISKINTSDALSFFTSALQFEQNFKLTDHLQRSVLHYLLTNNELAASSPHPPFNYLRSMMLFESNETLREALCLRDQKNLTPIEAYLFAHKNLTSLANHELTALLALIEIEHTQHKTKQGNYQLIIRAVGKLCRDQAQPANLELQRNLLVASYYTVAINHVVNDINKLN